MAQRGYSCQMDERYRLVFQGEVLDGQHAAVVKKKLGEGLKIASERLDALFSGKPVVIRKEVDTDEAARYQAAFKKAGARLRAMPVAKAVGGPAPQSSAGTEAVFDVAPVGELLRPEERHTVAPVKVRTDHLSFAPPDAPPSPTPAPVLEIDAPDWPLAPPGEPLSTERRVAPSKRAPTWSLAAPGTRLEPPKPAAPVAPDTSHLSLED